MHDRQPIFVARFCTARTVSDDGTPMTCGTEIFALETAQEQAQPSKGKPPSLLESRRRLCATNSVPRSIGQRRTVTTTTIMAASALKNRVMVVVVIVTMAVEKD